MTDFETTGEFESRNARIAHEKEVEARRELTSSTQLEHPWRAAIRTGVQVVLSLVAVTLAVIPIILETVGDLLPESWVAWLLAAEMVIAAVAALLARLMAAEPVLAFVARWLPWLAPKSTR